MMLGCKAVVSTSIKQSRLPLTDSQRPVNSIIVLHLYWTVTSSGTTGIKSRIIFPEKLNPCLATEINVSSQTLRSFDGSVKHVFISSQKFAMKCFKNARDILLKLTDSCLICKSYRFSPNTGDFTDICSVLSREVNRFSFARKLRKQFT